MKVRDMIKQLQAIANQDAEVKVVGNNIDGNDHTFDCNYVHVEIIEDSDEAITIFACHKID